MLVGIPAPGIADMILVGSRALALRAPRLLTRKSKDFDWMCTEEEFDTWILANSTKVGAKKVYPEKNKMIVEGQSNCEFEIIKPGTSAKDFSFLVDADPDTIETSFGKIPNLDLLFTLKSSHKYLKNSPHFWKTVIDYHMMKRAGAVVRPEYRGFLRQREAETYTYKHPKLNVKKDDFFQDDGIQYVWDHDDIHKSVARGERPAYTYYMKDGEQVACDKQKFFALPQEVRLNGVVEEAAVLAIERSLVPHPGIWTPEYAWKFALSKVCSSITSGWFREFGYEHLPEITRMYPTGYWEKFQADVADGKVKPYDGKRY